MDYYLASQANQPDQQTPYGQSLEYQEFYDFVDQDAVTDTGTAQQGESSYTLDQPIGPDETTTTFEDNAAFRGHGSDQLLFPPSGGLTTVQLPDARINNPNGSTPTSFPPAAFGGTPTTIVEPQDLFGGHGAQPNAPQPNWSPSQEVQPMVAQTPFLGGQSTPVASEPQGSAGAG
jgi:hypothetical protein